MVIKLVGIFDPLWKFHVARDSNFDFLIWVSDVREAHLYTFLFRR